MNTENLQSIKLTDLAALTQSELKTGTNSEADGLSIKGIKPLDSATSEDLSFFAPTSKKSFKDLFEKAKSSNALAIVVQDYQEDFSCIQLVNKNPMKAVIAIASTLHCKSSLNEGIHSTAVVDPSAEIASDAKIGPYVVVGKNVRIGSGTSIYPHVVIYDGAELGKNCLIHSGATIRENVQLGNNCTIQNGVVVGSDGFGYFPDETGERHHIPHVGTVRLGDRVDIGANAAIDRGTLGETSIDDGAKIDNLVQVGHNVSIGKRTVVCGTVALAGSSSLGSDTILGGNAAVADHVKVGNNVKCAGKAGVTSDIEDNRTIAGFPAIDASDWKRQKLALRRLPALVKEFKGIKKKLES